MFRCHFKIVSMKKRPFFSIVIPTFNRAEDLQFALFCLLQQSFKDFEIVISDNCSTDKTKEFIKKLKDERIRYYRMRKVTGNAINIGKAMTLAKGQYVFFHSDDDFLLHSYSLKRIYDMIKKCNPGFTRVNYFSLSLDKKKIFSYQVRKNFTTDEYIGPEADNRKVVSFILESDPYFISGIIFKNKLAQGITIIDSDPAPWFNIIFFCHPKIWWLFYS